MSDTATRPTSTELRERLIDTAASLRELREKPADERSDAWAAEIATQARVVGALDAEFEAVRAAERHELESLAWDAEVRNAEHRRSHGPEAAFQGEGRSPRDLGAQVAANAEYRAWIDGGANGPMPSIEIRALLDSDTTSNTDGNAGMWLPQGQPIPPTPRCCVATSTPGSPTWSTSGSRTSSSEATASPRT